MELIIDFIITAGIVIDSIILLFLFKKNKKELPQYILIVLFLFLICEFIIAYFFLHDIYFIKKISIVFSSAIPWFFGPLIFLYIKSLFTDDNKIVKKNLIHFIPYIAYVFYKSIYLIYIQPELDDATYTEVFDKKWTVDVVLSDLYFILYLFLTINIFYKFKKALKLNYSNLTAYDFIWIEYMLYGYLMVMIIDIFISIVGSYSLYGFYITIITTVIIIIFLGYYGINQSQVLVPDFLIKEIDNNKIIATSTGRVGLEDSIPSIDKKTNQLSSFSEKEIEELKIKLDSVLKKDKAFLDENLTLGSLAAMLFISDKKLSTLLNQYMDISFYDIINKQRVEAVKEMIISEGSEKYSLMGIAYECGFSSKSSFIRTFKKETSFTPSEYKKTIENHR